MHQLSIQFLILIQAFAHKDKLLHHQEYKTSVIKTNPWNATDGKAGLHGQHHTHSSARKRRGKEKGLPCAIRLCSGAGCGVPTDPKMLRYFFFVLHRSTHLLLDPAHINQQIQRIAHELWNQPLKPRSSPMLKLGMWACALTPWKEVGTTRKECSTCKLQNKFRGVQSSFQWQQRAEQLHCSLETWAPKAKTSQRELANGQQCSQMETSWGETGGWKVKKMWWAE